MPETVSRWRMVCNETLAKTMKTAFLIFLCGVTGAFADQPPEAPADKTRSPQENAINQKKR